MRKQGCGPLQRRRVPRRHQRAFSLVELLTVIFIIALLIGILIPSLTAARNAAKKTSSKSMLASLGTGLEMFKNDNGADYPQTNGYPPSFVHPPLTTFDPAFDATKANEGRFPFIDQYPFVYGAHWLPAMLMGVDNKGYIKRSAVPKLATPIQPIDWYSTRAFPSDPGKLIDRAPLYVTPETAPTRKTESLPGRKPDAFIANDEEWRKMKHLPVFVDAWDQAILYYASNTAGKGTNMVETLHKVDNDYSGADQAVGPPFYFHQDNELFTGRSDTAGLETGDPGWDYGNSGGKHAIKFSGAVLTAGNLILPENKESFAHYIVDRKIYTNLETLKEQGTQIEDRTPLRPVNANTYLLISPGVDGRYGTSDDVSNIPAFDSD